MVTDCRSLYILEPTGLHSGDLFWNLSYLLEQILCGGGKLSTFPTENSRLTVTGNTTHTIQLRRGKEFFLNKTFEYHSQSTVLSFCIWTSFFFFKLNALLLLFYPWISADCRNVCIMAFKINIGKTFLIECCLKDCCHFIRQSL